MSYAKTPKKKRAASQPGRPSTKARQQPKQARTYEKDRPPIYSVKGHSGGQARYFVRYHSSSETCLKVVKADVVKYGKAGSEQCEWVRDDDADVVREIRYNGRKGVGAALRA